MAGCREAVAAKEKASGGLAEIGIRYIICAERTDDRMPLALFMPFVIDILNNQRTVESACLTSSVCFEQRAEVQTNASLSHKSLHGDYPHLLSGKRIRVLRV